MTNGKIVFMLEDDGNLLKLNISVMERRGYTVYCATTISKATEVVSKLSHIDIAILDIVLPDGNGLDFASHIKHNFACPVLMLTSKSTHEDIVEGMSADVDIYMTKPYLIPELVARIEGLIKKSENIKNTILAIGKLRFDINLRQVALDGENLSLTPKDFTLLLFLAQREKEIVSQEVIFEKIWELPLGDDTSALRSAIARLRKKLVGSGYTVNSIRGQGYVFKKE